MIMLNVITSIISSSRMLSYYYVDAVLSRRFGFMEDIHGGSILFKELKIEGCQQGLWCPF
jgi:hypothetical protein